MSGRSIRLHLAAFRAVLVAVVLGLAVLALASATPAVAEMAERSGVGSQEVVGPFYLPGGLTRFEWTTTWDHESGEDFNVALFNSRGLQVGGPLVQEPACGDYSGSMVVQGWYKNYVTPGNYFFSVRAGGPWTFRIGQFTGPTVEGQSFSGTGTRVVGPFSLPGGVTTFNWSQTSTPPWWASPVFFVEMVDIDGVWMADQLVWRNDTGSSGSTVVQPSEFAPYYRRVLPGLYLLNVTSIGSWTINFESTPFPPRTAPLVSNPVAPARMSRRRSYTVYATLRPRHTAGSYPVRIYKYRYVSHKWKSYGFMKAKAVNYSGYTKCSVRVKLATKGKWRLRAYAPADAAHSAKWSGYRYVTVK